MLDQEEVSMGSKSSAKKRKREHISQIICDSGKDEELLDGVTSALESKDVVDSSMFETDQAMIFSIICLRKLVREMISRAPIFFLKRN